MMFQYDILASLILEILEIRCQNIIVDDLVIFLQNQENK